MQPDKKKMQDIAFPTVGALLDYLPEDQLDITLRLRDLVFECLPGVEERLSFNVPFYRLHRGVCFIWSGAVAWGNKRWDGVEFGFNYGNLLQDAANYLEKGNRKQVFSRRFYAVGEIKEDLLRAYLLEAAEIDELLARERKTKRKK